MYALEDSLGVHLSKCQIVGNLVHWLIYDIYYIDVYLHCHAPHSLLAFTFDILDVTTVNSEIFASILFSRIALKDTFAT